MKQSLIFLFLIQILGGIGYSVVSPLFPLLGGKNKLNESILGLIISTYALIGFIVNPIFPILCKKVGRINLLYVGTIGEATCMFLYGFLPFISSYYFLLIIIFTLRVIHGTSASINETLVYSLVCSISNDDEIQNAIAYLETAWIIGLSLGPLCSSVLYYIGGYSLPFIVLGLVLYISVYFTYLISKTEKVDSEEESEEEPSFFISNRYIINNI